MIGCVLNLDPNARVFGKAAFLANVERNRPASLTPDTMQKQDAATRNAESLYRAEVQKRNPAPTNVTPPNAIRRRVKVA